MRPVTRILALFLAAGVAAGPGLAAGAAPPAPGEGLEGAPPEVVDTVVFVDDTLIIGRVRSVTRHEVLVVAEAPNGPKGKWRFRRERVKRIEYDVDGRRRELKDASPARLLAFARWLEEVGLPAEAVLEYRRAAAAPGAPPEVILEAAQCCERLGDLPAALHFYGEYLLARPGAPDASGVKARIEELMAKVPPGQRLALRPVEGPEKPPEGPEKPPEGPEKPPEGPEKPPIPRVVEGLEIESGWRSQNWGRPAALSVMPDPQTKNRLLSIQVPAGGDQDKVAVGLHRPRNLADKKDIVFSVYNGTGKPVGVGFAVTGGGGFYEARTKFVQPGWTPNVRVTLKPASRVALYKCEATNWRYTAKPEGLERTRVLYFLFYHRKARARFYLDSIRFE